MRRWSSIHVDPSNPAEVLDTVAHKAQARWSGMVVQVNQGDMTDVNVRLPDASGLCVQLDCHASVGDLLQELLRTHRKRLKRYSSLSSISYAEWRLCKYPGRPQTGRFLC